MGRKKRSQPEPVNDPFALVPYEGPPTTTSQPATNLSLPSPLTQDDAARLLREEAQKLLTADAKTLPQLTRRIQRLRVVMLILQEVERGTSDPQVARELNLLNKLMSTYGDGWAAEDEKVRQREAEVALRERGIDPASAARLLRALEAVMGVTARDRPADPGS